jgi:hypothetical protein
MSLRNSAIQPNAGVSINRSWTRPIASAGADFELPYHGHLPTLGLIKRNRHHLPQVVEDELPGESRAGAKRYDNKSNPFTRESKTDKLLL